MNTKNIQEKYDAGLQTNVQQLHPQDFLERIHFCEMLRILIQEDTQIKKKLSEQMNQNFLEKDLLIEKILIIAVIRSHI